MSENKTGYLSSLAYGAASGLSLPVYGSDSYTEIPDIEELKLPAGTRPVEERKVLQQKASKKFVGSLSYSACTANGLRDFESAAQLQMRGDANAGNPVRRNFRGSLPNTGNEIHYFVGYCSKFEYGPVTNEGVYTFDMEIVVDGEVTIVD